MQQRANITRQVDAIANLVVKIYRLWHFLRN